MTTREKRPLVMAARRAFEMQVELGNTEPGEDFDTWRHAQVREVTGRAGLTSCVHDDYRPLMAHFLTLSGRDDAALALHLRSGKASQDRSDTHERRTQLAREITNALAAHEYLAVVPLERILEHAAQRAEIDRPGEPFEPDPAWIGRIRAIKRAIDSHGGPIGAGYVVALARHKTRRPTLTLGPSLAGGLAERCTCRQLEQLRATLTNRIAAREGRGSTSTRNRSQRRR